MCVPDTAGRQQGLETIRDTGERGMNDHRPKVCADAGAHHSRDVVPIGNGGHARAAEFEHNPGLITFEHSGDRTCDFNSPAPNRALPRGAGGDAPVSRLIVFENIAQFFSNWRSASTSSTRLQAALPRLPTATALGRRSVRSNRGSKSCDSSASPRNSSSISKCSSSRSLIVREKPLKSIGSISPSGEAAHYSRFCPPFN